MEDFFATLLHRWPEGRQHYHWHVLWDTELMRERLFEPYQALTHDRDGLGPVPPQWMHMTIQHFAPVDELDNDDLKEITRLVRNGCQDIGPFEVVIDQPQTWQYGLVCPIRPGEAVRRLWRLVVQAGRQVTGERFEIRPEPFYPHLTLAYPHGHVDHRPLRVWLSDCDIEPVRLPVTALSLVAQQHNRREITWRPLDEIPLNGGSA